MSGVAIVEADDIACRLRQADWCQGCGKTRHRTDMRWQFDAYRCLACLGDLYAGTPALWEDWGSSQMVRW